MNKSILISVLLLTFTVLYAQEKQPKKYVKSFSIDEKFATADTLQMDTLFLNFQTQNIINQYSIANIYAGNYGSPLQSMIYVQQENENNFIFGNNYKPYVTDASNVKFYDTTFPYSNLTYLTGGPISNREEQVKFLYTVGPSKKMNFGTELDYIFSKGRYMHQGAQRFAGSLFGRFNGKHYNAYGLAVMNNHKNHENGGLSNLDLLTNPDVEVQHKDMPTIMHGYSTFSKNTFYYNQNYSIGINREVKDKNDSISYVYVPVTRFGHVAKYEEQKKRYFEPSFVAGFYENTFDSINNTNDTTSLRTLSNLFSVSLAEEFNRWMKFGMTGFVENEIQQFTFFNDSLIQHTLKSNTKIGGLLSKTQGSNFRYHILGDLYVIGYKLGEFRLEGKAEGKFKLWNNELQLMANAFVKNEEPSFFLQNYYSNHFVWNNNFTKQYKTHIGGVFSLPKLKTRLHVAVENITDMIYFNEKALPTQFNGNVQILSADFKQDFNVGAFALENNVIYQVSSNQAVAPLPTLILYHNLYYHGKWFVDLYSQIGVDLRYHTKYLSPSFMPATAQFYNQNKIEIGNYPLLNAYANFHLKQARFFAQYTNLGGLFLKNWGFHMPNYPINPPMFKVGLSWNFYN